MVKVLAYLICMLCFSLSLVSPQSTLCVVDVDNDNYFFIIGDSLYDVGNNVMFQPSFPSNSCPYGMSWFHEPAGRLSDGRLIPDFIAAKLGLCFIPPYMNQSKDLTHGANFASAGSGVSDEHTNCINLGDQYKNYTNLVETWRNELGDEEANRRLKKAVYLISMGGNDYFSYSTNNKNASFSQMQDYVREVVTNLSDVIKDMYDYGGARKFMFQSVSALGCIPDLKEQFNISDGCARQPLTLAVLHNAALPIALRSIKDSSNYKEFNYSLFDFFSLLGERISDPENYGNLKVGDVPCYVKKNERGIVRLSGQEAVNCGDENRLHNKIDVCPLPYCVDGNGLYNGTDVCTNPCEYVFFDGGHNTDELNGQLAEQLWSGGSDFVYPYNMQQLSEYDPTTKICSKNNDALCAA